MMKAVLRFFIGVSLFLLPFTITVGFIRLQADKPAYVPTRAYVEYFAEYPESSVDDLKVSFSRVNKTGFAETKPSFQPDFSGNVFEDIKEVVIEGFNFLGSSISAIFDYIVWFFEVVYTVVKLVIDTVVWAFNLVPYIINY